MNLKALTLFAAALTLTAAENPLIGTWKLNVSKSKYVNIPTPKEVTSTYTAAGAGWKLDARGIDAEGKPTHVTLTFVKDGEPASITGLPYGEQIVFKNANSPVATGTFLRGGKRTGTVRRTFSSDGKTMTLTGNVALADGKRGTYTAVYDKQ